MSVPTSSSRYGNDRTYGAALSPKADIHRGTSHHVAAAMGVSGHSQHSVTPAHHAAAVADREIPPGIVTDLARFDRLGEGMPPCSSLTEPRGLAGRARPLSSVSYPRGFITLSGGKVSTLFGVHPARQTNRPMRRA